MKSLIRSLAVALVVAGVIAVATMPPDTASVAKVAPQRMSAYRPGSPVTPDTNIRSKSGYAAWMIDEFLAAQTPLPALGRYFIAAERKYGVNARILLAQALLESGYGSSWLAQSKKNLFGYHAYDRDPLRYASRYPTYQASITAVAKALAVDYLTPSGRFWGGLPTLRGVNMAYASDVRWAEKIAYLANVVDANIRTLRERGVRFAAPRTVGRVQARSQVTVKVVWAARAGAFLPAALTYAVRWTPVAVAENGITAPATLRAPTWTAVAHVSRTPSSGKGAVTLTVAAPPVAGLWRLDLDARDVTGGALPTGDHPAIPSTVVRVGAIAEATLGLQATSDGRLIARVTASGTRAISGAAGGGGSWPILEAWLLPLDPDRPATRLAARVLTDGVRPRQSVAMAFAAPSTPGVVVVRLAGSVASGVRAVPSVTLVTVRSNGTPVLTAVTVTDPRTKVAASSRTAKSRKVPAPTRVGVAAAKDPGIAALVVPAAVRATSAASGTAPAAAPQVLVRTLDAIAGRDGDPSGSTVAIAGKGGPASFATMPGGLRLVIVALIRPGSGSADPATVTASWVPVLAPTSGALPN